MARSPVVGYAFISGNISSFNYRFMVVMIEAILPSPMKLKTSRGLHSANTVPGDEQVNKGVHEKIYEINKYWGTYVTKLL